MSYDPKLARRIGEKNAMLIYNKNCPVQDEESKPFQHELKIAQQTNEQRRKELLQQKREILMRTVERQNNKRQNSIITVSALTGKNEKEDEDVKVESFKTSANCSGKSSTSFLKKPEHVGEKPAN